jgi:outer membrane protein
MKKPIRTLCALLAFGAGSLIAQAQPALKLVVVDMAKLYDTHWESIENKNKLQADEQRAQDDVAAMNTAGLALVEAYKALTEQASNPALTAEAKSKAQADAQKKAQEIQAKQQEVQTYMQNVQRSLQQRMQNFNSLMLEKIGKLAGEVGKRKGATLVLDKAGLTVIGISNIIYFDPAYDITDEVAKELAKDRPAGAATAPASADGPKAISLPTVPAKK